MFGWQGFSFDHPEDWAPTTLQGTRKEGYAGLTSSGRLGCHVRWKEAKPSVDLASRLDAYVTRLRADAKKKREPFHFDVDPIETGLSYRWTTTEQGRGAIFFCSGTQRVFFLELTAAKKDSILPDFRAVLESFKSEGGDLEVWSLLGLRIWLPSNLSLTSKGLHAGKTLLGFSGKKLSYEVQRWGFADALIEKHGLEAWARSLLRMGKATAEVHGQRLTLRQRAHLGLRRAAYVEHRPEENNVIVVDARFRRDEDEPMWEWFA